MCLASGVISVQLFLAVQNSSYCCLILQTGLSYHIMLMYYLNYEQMFVVQTVLPFTARCSSTHYFPTAANEPEVSHIHTKWHISVLKNKV